MSEHSVANLKFAIGYVLFIDIIGYSKLLITEQSESLRKLTALVRETEQSSLRTLKAHLFAYRPATAWHWFSVTARMHPRDALWS